MGENCCRNGGTGTANGAANGDGQPNGEANGSDFLPYDPTQEPIFPSELQVGCSLVWS